MKIKSEARAWHSQCSVNSRGQGLPLAMATSSEDFSRASYMKELHCCHSAFCH